MANYLRDDISMYCKLNNINYNIFLGELAFELSLHFKMRDCDVDYVDTAHRLDKIWALSALFKIRKGEYHGR